MPVSVSLGQAHHPDRVRVFGGVFADALPTCSSIASDERDVRMRLRCDQRLMMELWWQAEPQTRCQDGKWKRRGMPEAR